MKSIVHPCVSGDIESECDDTTTGVFAVYRLTYALNHGIIVKTRYDIREGCYTMIDDNRILPISVQSFEKLREEGCIYVDKTQYVYRVVHEVAQFFLSRPRRFGKSLLLSTIAAYWEGRKDLFSGLEIEKLEADNPNAWVKHPVFYIDFNTENYTEHKSLEDVLDAHLSEWEEEYGIDDPKGSYGIRFRRVIKEAHQKTGLRCVVLVDEYDKPLLEVVDSPELMEHTKAVLKGFFSVLKNRDKDLQSIFITGVTKFHKVSIFSDLNQLNDISLNEDFSGICGITDDELRTYFAPEITKLSERRKMDESECLVNLKAQYDGYHFSADSEGVYNPFSLLKSFFEKRFGSYWFETGTPTFLVKALRDNAFEVRRLADKTIYASESSLLDYTGDTLNPIPLLYQTGYLTIADFDEASQEYTLSFPNKEVKYGFLESLMPEYVSNCGAGSGVDISTLRRYVDNGDLESIRNVLTALFARITYTSSDAVFEHYFQTVIYLVFTLLGKYALCEMHTFSGRIDCRVLTSSFIYLFEFKRDESADKALQQINDKDYTLPFAADSRKLYKIGVSFDSEKRILSDWKVEE